MELLITLGFIGLYYKTGSVKTALLFVLIASLLSALYSFFVKKEKIFQQVLFFGLFLIFGAFTLIFDDPKIYMLKTSFSLTLLALAFLLWPFLRKRTLFEEMVPSPLCAKHTLSRIQNMSIVLCLLLAGINGYIVQYYDIIIWGQFKILLAIVTTCYTAGCLAALTKPWKKENSSS